MSHPAPTLQRLLPRNLKMTLGTSDHHPPPYPGHLRKVSGGEVGRMWLALTLPRNQHSPPSLPRNLRPRKACSCGVSFEDGTDRNVNVQNFHTRHPPVSIWASQFSRTGAGSGQQPSLLQQV